MNESNSVFEQNQLLTTKLYIPRPHSNLVSRPRLTLKLNHCADCTLIFISAPTGFGKTTLLSEWIYNQVEETRQIHHSRVAWISLDEGDNDPVRFMSYFIAALQTLHAGLGQTLLDALSSPQPPSIQETLTGLINEIATLPDDIFLILDDYHIIQTSAIHEAITFLLDNISPQFHLIITSRIAAPFSLGRLRARRRLLEITTKDLRFTATEAATFLNQIMNLELSEKDIDILEQRTEGWIAGLQLAALSMQGREDISSFIESFTGSHHYILEYLAEEVLNQQPENIQKFLLRTAILNRLTGPLCDAVTERKAASAKKDTGPLETDASSQTILEYLEQANLFIMPLDDERRWYRYHHLFADFLRNYLERQVESSQIAKLHHRAAEWYEKNGLTAEAVGHALAVADVERAARLIEQSGRTLLRRSEMATLLSWVEALPEEQIRTRPQLSLFHAWALVLTGQLEVVEARLSDFTSQKARDTVSSSEAGEMIAIQATVAYFRRDFPQAIKLYRQAFDQLPEENLFLRGAVAMSLATAYHIQRDIKGAKWAFTQARAISEASNHLHTTLIATLNLAQLHVEQAQLHRAEELYRQALQLAQQQTEESGQTLITGRIHVGLSNVLYQWNKLDEAHRHLQDGLKLGEQGGDMTTLMSGYLLLAQAKWVQGDPDKAQEFIKKAETCRQRNNLPSWDAKLAATRLKLSSEQDNLQMAQRWLKESQSRLNEHNIDDSAGYPEDLNQLEHLTQARLLISSQPDEATSLLDSLSQAAESAEQTELLIETLSLQSLARYQQREVTEAIKALKKALALAKPGGYLRLFADEGLPMSEILRQVRARNVEIDYIDQLLEVIEADSKRKPTPEEQPLIEPLSDRELEVMQLIAAGMSNRQISEELVLTVGTVKWHINNIYGKLGVRSRTQATAKARALKLL